jgi:hypothetical protein
MYGDPNKANEGIANFGKSIGEGLNNVAKIKALQAKEAAKSLAKLQEGKNKALLGYYDRLDNWSKKIPPGSDLMDSATRLLQNNAIKGADAEIALTTVTDSEERNKLYKIKKKVESNIDLTGEFGKNVGEETATWLTLKPLQLNTAGGWGINASDQELEPKTESMNILSGLNTAYKSHAVNYFEQEDGTLMLNVKGEREDGYNLDYNINVVDYINARRSGAGGFLQKIDDVKDYTTAALKGIYDPKLKGINPDFLEPQEGFAKLPMGPDRQRSIYGQRVNEEKTMDKIKEQASITAQGYLTAGGSANLRALLNSTLKKGTKFYDGDFKDKSNEEQLDILTNALAENTYSTLTDKMEYSYENGQKVFWSGPKLKVFVEKIEKPKINKATKDKPVGMTSSRVFSEDDVEEYVKEYGSLAKTGGKVGAGSFSVEIPGPKGGKGKEVSFFVENGKIYNSKSTKPVSLTDFKNFLRKQTYGPKPSL